MYALEMSTTPAARPRHECHRARSRRSSCRDGDLGTRVPDRHDGWSRRRVLRVRAGLRLPGRSQARAPHYHSLAEATSAGRRSGASPRSDFSRRAPRAWGEPGAGRWKELRLLFPPGLGRRGKDPPWESPAPSRISTGSAASLNRARDCSGSWRSFGSVARGGYGVASGSRGSSGSVREPASPY
jgi:hypothetical protein